MLVLDLELQIWFVYLYCLSKGIKETIFTNDSLLLYGEIQ